MMCRFDPQLNQSGGFVASIAVVVLVALSPNSLRAQEATTLESYEVRKGDTCVGIAIRELGDRSKYKEIHKHNKLGPLPHKLKPGSFLKLPKVGPSGPDANLSSQRGDVGVRRPAGSRWDPASVGMDLFRRWRVNSRKRSTAEITFRDLSRLRMRENTIVIIYGPSSGRTRRQTANATLEKGTLQTRLAELDGKQPRMVVETPSSEAELGGGSALVSVDDSASTRVSNHKGKPAKVRSRRKKARRSKAIAVGPGMGSKIEKGKDPTPPKPLPPAPIWVGGPTDFFGWARSGVTLTGAWTPVSQASRYRVEISRDAKGEDVVASVETPSNVTAFEAHGFPAGSYFATVASIDGDKFESAPSSSLGLKAELVSLTIFGSDTPVEAIEVTTDQAIDPTAKPAALRVLPGSVIKLPPGLLCKIGVGAPAGELIVPLSGDSLHCSRGGVALSPLPLEIETVDAVLLGKTREDRTISRKGVTTQRIQFSFSSETQLSKLVVNVSKNLVLVSRRNEARTVILELRAARRAGLSGTIEVRLGPKGPIVFSKGVGIERRKQRPLPPPPRIRRWEIGALIGGNSVDDEFELGNSPTPAGVPTGSWIVGLRAGLHVTPSFGVELEGTYSEPSFAELSDHANVLAYRVQALLHLREGRLRPFVLAGFGGMYLNTNSSQVRKDTDKEALWGLGARLKTGERSSVRLDIRHRVSGGRIGTFSNLFEASVGIGWML